MDTGMKQCVRLEMYLDGHLGNAASLDFEAHLSGCESCSAEVDKWQALKAGYVFWLREKEAASETEPSSHEAADFVAVIEEKVRLQQQISPQKLGTSIWHSPSTPRLQTRTA